MSNRPGILVTQRTTADGRWPLTVSPNQQVDVITAEVRCHWPHPAPKEEVLAALAEAHRRAVAEVEAYPYWAQIARPAAPE